MNSLNTASLINLLGFIAGVALYALLLAMVVRHRRSKESYPFDFLLLATAILGLLWNVGELVGVVWKDFGVGGRVSPILLAISYSALGFLPSVVIHSAWKNSAIANRSAKILTFAAYGLSTLAAFFHFHTVIFSGVAPSSTALLILTAGALALLVGLLVFNYRQTLENKKIWIAALLIFALSALHLSFETEGSSWIVELVAHQSSLPLALAILLQDYRFAFADLFLKRALSLLLVTAAAFGLYVFVAAPLLHYHETHDRNDTQAIAIILTLWVTTALVYPKLHNFAVWLVDKIILRRVDYEILRFELSQTIENQNSVAEVLNETCNKLATALTAQDFSWNELTVAGTNLSTVNFNLQQAKIFIPVVEAPFFEIDLKDFSGGRRLLSDEIKMLEAAAILTARRVDALRVSSERFEQKIREQEFSRLAAEAQLTALRAQINPHFLFNALTTIGYLIQTTPEKAFDTLMKLTQLLRRVLKSGSEFSTLDEEIKLVESYLEIERARFEERLEIQIEVPQELGSLQIPALILQPLVENAVKHGISKAERGGTVKISACLENNQNHQVFLRVVVYNDGEKINTSEFLRNKQIGVGLKNVEQRLLSHYGKAAAFEIKSEMEKGTIAEIKMPVSKFNLTNLNSR